MRKRVSSGSPYEATVSQFRRTLTVPSMVGPPPRSSETERRAAAATSVPLRLAPTTRTRPERQYPQVYAVALSGRSKGRRLVRQIGSGVVLALTMAIAPISARDATPAPVKIAVFDFELEDLSPSAAAVSKPTSSATTMEKVSNAAREELAQSGRYVVIDASKVDATTVAEKTLRECAGCEADIAQQLGAQQSLIGLVRKVTQTDYYVVIRIRDARSGKILDQEEANFAGDEAGWVSGVRMLIRHQVLPNKD